MTALWFSVCSTFVTVLCMLKKNMGLPWWLSGKESACNAGAAGDVGSIPGSGRSPGGGQGNPLQYSCLENPMDRGAWRATVHGVMKSWTRLKQLSMHAHERDVWVSLVAQGVKHLPASQEMWGCRVSPWVGTIPGDGNGDPLQYSCLENPVARGAWRATVPGAAESRPRLRD